MFYKLNRIFCAITLLFLSGCSLPEIQKNYVDINPNMSFPKVNIGHGKSISVRVEDFRSSQSLGSTCLPYGGRIILSKNDIKNTLQHGIESILRAWNFKITPNSESRFLRLTLLGLSDGTCTITGSGEDAVSIIKITLVNGKEHYEKIYYESVPSNRSYTLRRLANDLTNSVNKTLKNISQDKKLINKISN